MDSVKREASEWALILMSLFVPLGWHVFVLLCSLFAVDQAYRLRAVLSLKWWGHLILIRYVKTLTG